MKKHSYSSVVFKLRIHKEYLPGYFTVPMHLENSEWRRCMTLIKRWVQIGLNINLNIYLIIFSSFDTSILFYSLQDLDEDDVMILDTYDEVTPFRSV